MPITPTPSSTGAPQHEHTAAGGFAPSLAVIDVKIKETIHTVK
jgi:hypothetical protein